MNCPTHEPGKCWSYYFPCYNYTIIFLFQHIRKHSAELTVEESLVKLNNKTLVKNRAGKTPNHYFPLSSHSLGRFPCSLLPLVKIERMLTQICDQLQGDSDRVSSHQDCSVRQYIAVLILVYAFFRVLLIANKKTSINLKFIGESSLDNGHESIKICSAFQSSYVDG
mgnify:CR=1 FL=1